MKIIYVKDEYIKCDMTAFNYETKGEYLGTYFERMLIANDEDKLNSLKVKSDTNLLE